MPCDIAVLNAMDGRGVTDAIMEAVAILNNQFEKRKVIKNNGNYIPFCTKNAWAYSYLYYLLFNPFFIISSFYK